MKKTRFILVRLLSVIMFLSLSVSLTQGQEVKLAATFEHECSQFYGGFATIKELEDDYSYYFINRKGERMGKAPGMLKWANEENRIYEKDGKVFLTNAKNKKISNF